MTISWLRIVKGPLVGIGIFGILGIMAVAAGVIWAAVCSTPTCCTTTTNLTLRDPKPCLQVSYNASEALWINNISFNQPTSTSFVIGAVESESTNILAGNAFVSIDGGVWKNIWNTDHFTGTLSVGDHCFQFGSYADNVSLDGNLVVWFAPQNGDAKFRHFGWRTCKQ